MKKFFAILLAAMMLLSFASVAMADEITTVNLGKVYKLVGAGSSPAETFTLKVLSSSVSESEATSAPDLGTITGAAFDVGAATADGATVNIVLNLPEFDKVGIYDYILQENADAKTPGVTYEGKKFALRVTVVNDESEGATAGDVKVSSVKFHGVTESENGVYTITNEKFSSIENTYSAGTLKVSKTVTGNMGDKNKYFEFSIKLTGEEGKTYAACDVSGGSEAAENATSIAVDGQAHTFKLKHDDTIIIKNIPYGVSYVITETAAEGYTPTQTGDAGTIGAAEQTAAFTNNREGTPDTGISLDTLPYVLMLTVVAAGVVAMIARKRRVED